MVCNKAGFVKQNWFYLQLVPENRDAQLWITFKHINIACKSKIKQVTINFTNYYILRKGILTGKSQFLLELYED